MHSRTLANTKSSGLNQTERNNPLIVYRESGAKKERRVGAMRSKVEVVSLAEQDASRGGSDLPNRVGQVIGCMRNGQSRQSGDTA